MPGQKADPSKDGFISLSSRQECSVFITNFVAMVVLVPWWTHSRDCWVETKPSEELQCKGEKGCGPPPWKLVVYLAEQDSRMQCGVL